MLEAARGLDPWHRPEGSRPLGRRLRDAFLDMTIKFVREFKVVLSRATCGTIDQLLKLTKTVKWAALA